MVQLRPALTEVPLENDDERHVRVSLDRREGQKAFDLLPVEAQELEGNGFRELRRAEKIVIGVRELPLLARRLA
jgi:hypothetical protein